MARIVWSPEASRRLIEIEAYVRLTASERAEAVVDRIVDAVDRLSDFPNMGRLVSEDYEPGARELIVDNFRIIYTTDRDTVEVSTILHSAMDVSARLRELLGDE